MWQYDIFYNLRFIEEFDDYIETVLQRNTNKANTKVDIYKDKVMIQRMGEINMEGIYHGNGYYFTSYNRF